MTAQKLKFDLNIAKDGTFEYLCNQDGFRYTVVLTLDKWRLFRGMVSHIKDFSELNDAFAYCQEQYEAALAGGITWKTSNLPQGSYEAFGRRRDKPELFQIYRLEGAERYVANCLEVTPATTLIKHLGSPESLERAQELCSEYNPAGK